LQAFPAKASPHEAGGTAVTARLYGTVFVTPPPVPLMVIEYVPVGVVAAVEIVNVEDAVGLMDDGLKEQDAPDGSPAEHDSDTDCVEPLVKVAVAVVAALEPCTTEPLEGLTDTEKSKVVGALTVRL